MAEMPPQLSVVVCTHNRPDDLERCLDALARLDDEPQVIVVDSATEPPCEALVARYERPSRSRLRVRVRAGALPGAKPGRRARIGLDRRVS